VAKFAMARNLIMLDGLSRSEKAGIEGRHSLLRNLGAFFRKALYRGASLPVSVKPFHLSSDLPSCRSPAARFWRTWIKPFPALGFGEVHIVQRFMKQGPKAYGSFGIGRSTRKRNMPKERSVTGTKSDRSTSPDAPGDSNLGTIQPPPFCLATSGCAGGAMRGQMPIWDREEVIVCIVLALCIGNALITVIYRIA
jgi:hypothetical protein